MPLKIYLREQNLEHATWLTANSYLDRFCDKASAFICNVIKYGVETKFSSFRLDSVLDISTFA